MKPLMRKWPILAVIILVVIFILLIIITALDTNNVTGLESIFGGIAGPIQGFFGRVTGSIGDFFGSIGKNRDLQKDYDELALEASTLATENQQLQDMKQENERLKALLNYSEEHPELTVGYAKVTAKNPGTWFSTFVIDQGTNQGVEVDMAVINENGLVGRVMETGGNWSKVVSIIDGRSSVSGLIERTRDNGVLRGTLDTGVNEGLCHMYYLPFESELLPGDVVSTSGLGGVYPKGIPIGEITEVSRSGADGQKYAVVRPYVDFYHLEGVLVVRSSTEQIEVD